MEKVLKRYRRGSSLFFFTSVFCRLAVFSFMTEGKKELLVTSTRIES